MYATENSTMITSKVKAMISTCKAVGFELITDKFLKRNRNFRYLANYLNCIMNGLITPGNMVNRARMMLLSKKKTPVPPSQQDQTHPDVLAFAQSPRSHDLVH